MSGNLSYMKSNSSKLGNWIRQGLKDVGRNQVWLAEKIGVQPPQVSRIISGSSEVTPDLLSAMADALGRPRAQAYRAAGYLNPEPVSDEWVEEMSHKLTLLPANLRSVVGVMINAVVEDNEPGQQKTKPKPRPKSSTS